MYGSRVVSKTKRKRLSKIGLVDGFENYSDRWQIDRRDIIEFSRKYPDLVGRKGPLPKHQTKSKEPENTNTSKKKKSNSGSNRPDVIDAIELVCEKNGSVAEVGPEYYRDFAKLDDNEIRALIRILLLNGSTDVYQTASKPNGAILIAERVYSELSFVSWGLMQISPFGKPAFYKRLGPEATSEEMGALTRRVEISRKIITEVIEDLIPAMLASHGKQTELEI